MSEEWGPWIKHDGKGCPCVGSLVNGYRRDGREFSAIAGRECLMDGIDPNGLGSAWVWTNHKDDVILYRICKPRGMAILESLLTDLPEKVDA